MGSEIPSCVDEHVNQNQAFVELIHDPCLPNQRIFDIGNAKFLQFVNVAADFRIVLNKIEGVFVFGICSIPDRISEFLLDMLLDVLELHFGAVKNDNSTGHD